MTAFQALRVAHEYTQHNEAPPEKVFPLLCPVREAEWVPGWHYRMIYSKSGVAEDGCVFSTPNDAGPETVWVVTEYDPAALRIAFVWSRPEVACRIQIALTARSQETTAAHIRYSYTGLSVAGNKEIAGYSRHWFEDKMKGWEKAINHYLRTGQRMSAPSN
jgi:hypothetical protein